MNNADLIEIAKHSNESIEAVVRTYKGGCSARVRDRIKISADVLGLEPPPERGTDPETSELNFDE